MANPEFQFGGLSKQFVVRLSPSDMPARDQRALAEWVVRDLLKLPEALAILEEPDFANRVWAVLDNALDAIA